MDKIRYFFREALKNIWANRMMSLASVSILTVCLVLLGSSLLLSLNISKIIRQIGNANQIMVFLSDGVDTTAKINEIGNKISGLPNVKQCVFISKTQALNEQKKSMGSYANLLNGLQNDNPLPNSYRIVMKNMSGFNSVVTALKKMPGISNIQQHADVAEKLNKMNNIISIMGIWLFILLVVVSLFIISNTIKLAMYVRKREVNIMKFVGATDWFIRWPFILEGFLLGLISGLIAYAAQWYIYEKLVVRAFRSVNFIQLANYSHMFTYIFVCFAGAGIIVGMLGSVISVRRYLKV